MWTAIQKNVSWRAIPVAGLLAGTVFLLTNLLLSWLVFDIQPGLFLRYVASLALGSDVLTTSGEGAWIAGLGVHYALSLLFALVIAIVIHRWGLWVGIIGGGVLGLAIYAINLYTMTLLFDWFFAINSTVLAASHALFGAVAGGTYELFDHYDTQFELEMELNYE
ncbi:MAG: hypothetical protein ACLFTK_15765 [Anaerolineales bacterium]